MRSLLAFILAFLVLRYVALESADMLAAWAQPVHAALVATAGR